MTTFQKIIKIFAVFLGVFIIVSIVNVFLIAVGLISGISLKNSNNDKVFEEVYRDLKTINIDVDSANINVKLGDQFKVEASNLSSGFYSKNVNGVLKIREKRTYFRKNNQASDITVYIPSEVLLNKLDIDSKAGEINLSNVNLGFVEISQGAGILTLKKVVSEKIEIDGGVGKIKVRNSTLNDLDLDAGVGKVDIEANITGNSKIDCGVGEINLDLLGKKDNYTIILKKGLGSIMVDNKEYNSDAIYGYGINKLQLSGGIGKIEVNFN